MNFRDVPIPERMRQLRRDKRGYPIPFAVFWDGDTPHFTINDEITRRRIIKEDLCSICGQKLFRGRWFIGGPRAALHPQGAYLDMPMHDECAHYALQVCPYLAMPHWAHEIGQHKQKTVEDAVIIVDESMSADRPPVFIAVMAVGQRMVAEGRYVKPLSPYRKIEYWRDGHQISIAEAWPEMKADMLKVGVDIGEVIEA